MSARSQSTTVAAVTNLLHEAQRALGSVRLSDPKVDLADLRATVEGFLDTLAAVPSTTALSCEDCGATLPEYRVKRWYHAAPNEQVFDVLCRSCAATREDVEDEVQYYTFHQQGRY